MYSCVRAGFVFFFLKKRLPKVQASSKARVKNHLILYAAAVVLCIALLGIGVLGSFSLKNIYSYASIAACMLLINPLDFITLINFEYAKRCRTLKKWGCLTHKGEQAVLAAQALVLTERDLLEKSSSVHRVITAYKTFDLKKETEAQDAPILKMLHEMALLSFDDTQTEINFCQICNKFKISPKQLRDRFPQTENGNTFSIPGGVRRIERGEIQAVLTNCTHYLSDGSVQELTDTVRAQLKQDFCNLQKEGNVFALSYGDFAENQAEQNGLTFLGMFLTKQGVDPDMLNLVHGMGNQILLCVQQEEFVQLVSEECTNYIFGTPQELQEQLAQKEQNGCSLAAIDSPFAVSCNLNTKENTANGILYDKNQWFAVQNKLKAAKQKENKIICCMALSKIAMLLPILLMGFITFTMPFNFYQAMWLAIAQYPVYRFFEKSKVQAPLYVQDNGLRFAVWIWALVWGGIICLSYIFARYTIPAFSTEHAMRFAQSMCFWVSMGTLFTGALQCTNRGLLTGGAFLKQKNLLYFVICLCVGCVILYCIPAAAVQFTRWRKDVWAMAFILLFATTTDLAKYIRFKKFGNTEKENEYV